MKRFVVTFWTKNFKQSQVFYAWSAEDLKEKLSKKTEIKKIESITETKL